MNVLYVFSTPNASYILENMIVPQLENDTHPVTVAGMFFFVDNNYLLLANSPVGERLAQLSAAGKIGFLMGCDQCCEARHIESQLVAPASIGCFPQMFAAAGETQVQQVITL